MAAPVSEKYIKWIMYLIWHSEQIHYNTNQRLTSVKDYGNCGKMIHGPSLRPVFVMFLPKTRRNHRSIVCSVVSSVVSSVVWFICATLFLILPCAIMVTAAPITTHTETSKPGKTLDDPLLSYYNVKSILWCTDKPNNLVLVFAARWKYWQQKCNTTTRWREEHGNKHFAPLCGHACSN